MSLFDSIASLGAAGVRFVRHVGEAGCMLFRALIGRPEIKKHFPLLVRQIYVVGVLSVTIILVSGLFIGMVLGLQGYNVLVEFKAEGRAGSALTAEIGLMKATEQLSSMEMMAVDPLRRVVSPRFWAGIYSLPVLTVMFCVIGVYGGKLVGCDWLGLDDGTFWSATRNSVDLDDIVNCMVKSAVFAFIVNWVSLYRGWVCLPTAEGISKATTGAVVDSSLLVLGADFVLTAVMFN